jgi:lipoprotein
MKDKVIFLIGIMNMVISCETPINSLEKKKINYQELPKPVKERIFSLYGDLPEEEQDRIEYKHIFRDLNNPPKYEYYTKQEFFFRWIYNGYIKNKETKKVYTLKKEITEERGSEFIIYGDSLYIPNHYNIYEKDSLSYTFTRFILR